MVHCPGEDYRDADRAEGGEQEEGRPVLAGPGGGGHGGGQGDHPGTCLHFLSGNILHKVTKQFKQNIYMTEMHWFI